MSVRDIIAEWLKAHGYGGLTNDECGCDISDLMPCDEDCSYCAPAYRHPCQSSDCDECQAECDGWQEGRCLYSREPLSDQGPAASAGNGGGR